MDNATFHKRTDMKDALRQAGHTPLSLPPYSPSTLSNISGLHTKPSESKDAVARKSFFFVCNTMRNYFELAIFAPGVLRLKSLQKTYKYWTTESNIRFVSHVGVCILQILLFPKETLFIKSYTFIKKCNIINIAFVIL